MIFKEDSSRMDQIVEFFQPQESGQIYDNLGVHPRQDVAVYKCWAAIIPQTGSRMNGSVDNYFLERTTHKFVIRYTAKASELTADMIIKFKGKEYQILYILNPYEKNETFEIFAEHKMQGSGY